MGSSIWGVKKSDFVKFIGLIVVLISFLIFLFYFNYSGNSNDFFNISKIQEVISGFGIWAPLIYIILHAIALVTFFPITILIIIGSLLFGGVLGSVYSVIGATLGAIMAFYIARLLGKGFVDSITENKFKRVDKFNKQIQKNGFIATFVARISPIFHYSGMSYILGITKVKFWDYLFGTLLGISIWVFAISYISDALIKLNVQDIIISSIFLIVLVFIIPIYKYVKKFVRYLRERDK